MTIEFFCISELRQPLLIALFFIKSSRDERGRAIIGKASIISMIVFIFLVNFFAKISDSIPINYDTVVQNRHSLYRYERMARQEQATAKGNIF